MTEARAQSGDHQFFAVAANNLAWDLIEKADRSPSETETMLHTAHASCWHWSPSGEPVHLVRAHYLLAKAYFAADRVQQAISWALRCWEGTQELNLIGWDLAFGMEICARVSAAQADSDECKRQLDELKALIPTLDVEDQTICENELEREPWFGLTPK